MTNDKRVSICIKSVAKLHHMQLTKTLVVILHYMQLTMIILVMLQEF